MSITALACRFAISIEKLFILEGVELTPRTIYTVLYGRPAAGKTLLLKLPLLALAPRMLAREGYGDASRIARLLLDELYPGYAPHSAARFEAMASWGDGELRLECRLGGGELPVCKPYPPSLRGVDEAFPVLAMVEERLAAVKEASRSIAEGRAAQTPLAAYYQAVFRRLARLLARSVTAATSVTSLHAILNGYASLLLDGGLEVEPDGLVRVDGVPLHAQSSTIVNLALAAILLALAEYHALRAAGAPSCPLLILDLPEQGLTLDGMMRLADALARLAKQARGATVLMATHSDVLAMLLHIQLKQEGLGDQIRFYQLRRDGATRLEPLEPGKAPEYLRWSLRRLHERLRKYLAHRWA